MYKFKFLSDDPKFVSPICEFEDHELGVYSMGLSCEAHNTMKKDTWTFEEILDTEPEQA